MHLRILVAICAVLANSACTVPPSHSGLKSGPMLGDLTNNRVRIWAATDVAQSYKIELADVSQQPLRWLSVATLDAVGDLHPRGSVLVSGLSENTHYRYRLVARDGEVIDSPSQQFVTSGAQTLRVAFGSCAGNWGPNPAQPIFKSVAALEPNWFLWMGDNVYYDRDYDEWTSLRLMQDRWAKQRSLTNLQPLLSSTSHAAIWDDHDYGPNDSDKTYTLRKPSLELFQSYWPNAEYPNPEDGVYHRLSLQHTDVFMLDTRFNREPNNLVKPNKELLGREQWQWLKSELLASRATFKIIVSSMQVLAEYHDYECWKIFPEQRQQLFDFLKDNEIEGVVLLSGDRHIGEVIVKQHLLSYPVTEFTASPLAAGVGGGVPDAQVPYRVPGSLVTAEHFGILDFDFNSDDPSLIYSARDVNGEVLGARIEIRASQLKCRQ